MNFPKTGEELKTEILISSDKNGDLRLRQLLEILLKVDHDIIVEGVIMVFENNSRPDTKFRDQEFAGKILEGINPKSEKDLEILLRRALKNWDKSVEQLPFWFRDNYGIEKTKACFNRIDLPSSEIDKLETMKWWLQIKSTPKIRRSTSQILLNAFANYFTRLRRRF